MTEIRSQYDAKCIVAEMHNHLLKSLESKDTPNKRRAISLLRELFEHNNYSIVYNTPYGTTELKSEETFPNDYSSRTSKRNHKIFREMWFLWEYTKEDNIIGTRMSRCEHYLTDEGYYFENVIFSIDYNVALKKVTWFSKEKDENKFSPR